jgi:hypothetical protein
MTARDAACVITLVMMLGPIERGKALPAAACEEFADGCAAAAGTCATETAAASMPVAFPEANDAWTDAAPAPAAVEVAAAAQTAHVVKMLQLIMLLLHRQLLLECRTFSPSISPLHSRCLIQAGDVTQQISAPWLGMYYVTSPAKGLGPEKRCCYNAVFPNKTCRQMPFKCLNACVALFFTS